MSARVVWLAAFLALPASAGSFVPNTYRPDQLDPSNPDNQQSYAPGHHGLFADMGDFGASKMTLENVTATQRAVLQAAHESYGRYRWPDGQVGTTVVDEDAASDANMCAVQTAETLERAGVKLGGGKDGYLPYRVVEVVCGLLKEGWKECDGPVAGSVAFSNHLFEGKPKKDFEARGGRSHIGIVGYPVPDRETALEGVIAQWARKDSGELFERFRDERGRRLTIYHNEKFVVQDRAKFGYQVEWFRASRFLAPPGVCLAESKGNAHLKGSGDPFPPKVRASACKNVGT